MVPGAPATRSFGPEDVTGRERMPRIGRMRLAVRLLPQGFIDGREMRIRRYLGVHPGQIQVAGMRHHQAVDLTAADHVILLDPWWNPAVEAQAIDRAHRIGQENKVIIYKFISRNTVEEKIMALQERKMALAGELISTEESFMKSLSKEDVEALLD